MSLVAGTRLGPYEIQSAIGAGGMGEVYKARDTRLDRTVATNVLPADAARSSSRRSPPASARSDVPSPLVQELVKPAATLEREWRRRSGCFGRLRMGQRGDCLRCHEPRPESARPLSMPQKGLRRNTEDGE
jgi:serine/threonine protein kinase